MYRLFVMLVGAMILTIVVLAAGCGDDDEKIVTSTAPPAFIDAYVVVEPECFLSGDVFTAGGFPPYLDSVKVGDSLISIDTSTYFGSYDPYYNISFMESGSSYMYESGDDATVTFYGRVGTSSATVTLLNPNEDRVIVLYHDYGESVPQGEILTFIWSSLAHVEWYALEVVYEIDTGLGNAQYQDYTYAMDTTCTFAADYFNSALNWISVSILPCTGPDPRTANGNITGPYATGKVFSYGGDTEILMYGEGYDVKSGISKKTQCDIIQEIDPRAVIQGVFNAARQQKKQTRQ